MGQKVKITRTHTVRRRVRKVGNGEIRCPTCKGTGKVKK